MPTFGDDHRPQVEAHLVGFDGDLYNQTLTLELLDWLRDQQKFPTLDALKSQLARDVSAAKRLADLDAPAPSQAPVHRGRVLAARLPPMLCLSPR